MRAGDRRLRAVSAGLAEQAIPGAAGPNLRATDRSK